MFAGENMHVYAFQSTFQSHQTSCQIRRESWRSQSYLGDSRGHVTSPLFHVIEASVPNTTPPRAYALGGVVLGTDASIT